MNRIRRIAAILGGLAASVLVTLTGATAAFAYPVPRRRPGVPGAAAPRVHTIVTGGMPGWQIALIAIGAAIFAAALAVSPRPGPHRTPAADCARRLTRWLPSSVRAA